MSSSRELPGNSTDMGSRRLWWLFDSRDGLKLS